MDDSAVGGAEHYFRFSVAVPVVGYDVDLVVLEVSHVRTEIDPPFDGAVHLKTFHYCENTVVAVMEIVALVVIFHYELEPVRRRQRRQQ